MDIVPIPRTCSEEEAEKWIHYYRQPGLGREKSIEAYNQTSLLYEEFLRLHGTRAGPYLASVLADLFPVNRDMVKVIDIACGTGIVGKELQSLGFRLVDGVDPAEKMLEVARSKKAYRELLCALVSQTQPLDIPNGSYDVATLSGALGTNQFPATAYSEVIRLVRPGGLVVTVTREENFRLLDDPETQYERHFRKLEEEGRWRLQKRITFPEYEHGVEGALLIHEVL